MKTWRCKAGSFDNLILKQEKFSVDEVILKGKEILIETKAIGLNFADVFGILGLYSATPKGEYTPGLEFSGIVLKTTEKSKFKIGDRVFGILRFGAMTTHLLLQSEDYCRLLPSSWSFVDGASFTCPALTAWYALVELGNLKKHQRVLIHSGCGGVGLFAIEICKAYGATPIVTVSSENKKDYLVKNKGLSKEQIIVRTNAKDFANQLKTACATITTMENDETHSNGSSDITADQEDSRREDVGCIDIVLDSLGQDYFMPAYESMRRCG